MEGRFHEHMCLSVCFLSDKICAVWLKCKGVLLYLGVRRNLIHNVVSMLHTVNKIFNGFSLRSCDYFQTIAMTVIM